MVCNAHWIYGLLKINQTVGFKHSYFCEKKIDRELSQLRGENSRKLSFFDYPTESFPGLGVGK